MWPVATYVASNMVCVLGTWLSCAKIAEPIEMPFGADPMGQGGKY